MDAALIHVIDSVSFCSKNKGISVSLYSVQQNTCTFISSVYIYKSHLNLAEMNNVYVLYISFHSQKHRKNNIHS